MRYSGRPSASAKASRYSISAASAQAKARRREDEATHRNYSTVGPSTHVEQPVTREDYPERKRKPGYYDTLMNRLKPKIYQGRKLGTSSYSGEGRRPKFNDPRRALESSTSGNEIRAKPKPQWLEEVLVPKSNLKRLREEEDELQDPRSYDDPRVPNKNARITTNPFTSPMRYTTPPQYILPPFIPHRNIRPSSDSHNFIPRSAEESPALGYGSGFSFDLEPKALRFERKMQPSLSPAPFRFSSTFGLHGRPDSVIRLTPSLRSRKTANYFDTPRRTNVGFIDAPHLSRSIYLPNDTARYYTPDQKRYIETPIASHHPQGPEKGMLPFSLPYRRNQSYIDFGRKAPALAFQPSMPVIAEESDLEEGTTVQIYSESTKYSSPIHDQGGEIRSLHFDDSRDTYFDRPETPTQTKLASARNDLWQARSNGNMISSQSTASRDENRSPSEASVVSLPIYAPKASLGIDIEALELAARSPSMDEMDDGAAIVNSKADHPPKDSVYPALQQGASFNQSARQVPRPVLSFTAPDTLSFPQSSQKSKQNEVRRPVPKRRRKNFPVPIFPIETELVNPTLPSIFEFQKTSPVMQEAKPIGHDEDVESIRSFEDDSGGVSGGGTAATGDPAFMSQSEETTAPYKAKSPSSVDMEREPDNSSEVPMTCERQIGNEGDHGYPGFEIWRDDSTLVTDDRGATEAASEY